MSTEHEYERDDGQAGAANEDTGGTAVIALVACYIVKCARCKLALPPNDGYLTSFDDDRTTIHFDSKEAALAAIGTDLAGAQLADGALPNWPAGTILDARCLAVELCAVNGCDWEPWATCRCTVDLATGALVPPRNSGHQGGCTSLRMCRRPFCGAVQQRTPDGVESLLELTT